MIDRTSLLIICVTIVLVVSITADCIKNIIKTKKEVEILQFVPKFRQNDAPHPAENEATDKVGIFSFYILDT